MTIAQTQSVIGAGERTLSAQEKGIVCAANLQTLSDALTEVMEVDRSGAEKYMEEKAKREGITVSELEAPRLRGSQSVIDINEEDNEDDDDDLTMTAFIDLTEDPQTIDLTRQSDKAFTTKEKSKGKSRATEQRIKRKRVAGTGPNKADDDNADGEYTTKSPV